MSNIKPEHDVIDVTMLRSLALAFEEWLEARGLYLAQTPEFVAGPEDPEAIPCYFVGITDIEKF